MEVDNYLINVQGKFAREKDMCSFYNHLREQEIKDYFAIGKYRNEFSLKYITLTIEILLRSSTKSPSDEPVYCSEIIFFKYLSRNVCFRDIQVCPYFSYMKYMTKY